MRRDISVDGMEIILLHLIGDYITQTDWMAVNKTKSSFPAVLHATIYSIPFMLLMVLPGVLLIFLSHFLIDRFRLARFVAYAKNKVTAPSLKWREACQTGYHKDTPPWMAFWLLIIVDNILHLCIAWACFKAFPQVLL